MVIQAVVDEGEGRAPGKVPPPNNIIITAPGSPHDLSLFWAEFVPVMPFFLSLLCDSQTYPDMHMCSWQPLKGYVGLVHVHTVPVKADGLETADTE